MIHPPDLGPKALHLLQLRELFPQLVPEFFVIEFDSVFSNWESVNVHCGEVATQYLNRKITSQRVAALIEESAFRLKINEAYLAKVLQGHDLKEFVSLRTSATFEDLDQTAMAGMYITLLDQQFDIKTISHGLVLCFKGLYSQRVCDFARSRGLKKIYQGGSVIVQKMFYSEKSGVIFTENGKNSMEVAFADGYENQIVSGAGSVSMIISKLADFSDQDSNLSLGMQKLFSVAKNLEEHIGKPLDIEWGIANEELALFQFRPVTTPLTQFSMAWDSTNISESYPGITLPLTYTTIRRLYAKVYQEFFKLVGYDDQDLKNFQDVFMNMLGYIEGRVFYNIDNWYEMLKLLPGYSYNKDFFELMLMPRKKKIENSRKEINLIRQFNLLKYGGVWLWLIIRSESLGQEFTTSYKKWFPIYEKTLWNSLSAQEVLKTYFSIEKNLLELWAIPILNDFRTMVFHGILRKWFIKDQFEPAYLQWVRVIYDHTSLEPLHELQKLADEIGRMRVSKKRSKKNFIRDLLSKKEFGDIRNKIVHYIDRYGGRSPGELKLENPRIGESFEEFVVFLVEIAEGRKQAPEVGKLQISTANTFRDAHNWLVRWLVNETQKSLMARERFRFYRAQVFGIARKAYLALGNRFVEAGILMERDDIFWMTREEVEALVLGHSADRNIAPLIEMRKDQFKKFRASKPAKRILGEGVLPLFSLRSDDLLLETKKRMSGIGVSSGVFEGEVVLAHEFNPRLNVSGKILVTEVTDPGWTLLFINAGAVVVERGNALSHAAIVSRELGLPAIVNVENICNLVKNGQRIRVDGTSGEVTLL